MTVKPNVGDLLVALASWIPDYRYYIRFTRAHLLGRKLKIRKKWQTKCMVATQIFRVTFSGSLICTRVGRKDYNSVSWHDKPMDWLSFLLVAALTARWLMRPWVAPTGAASTSHGNGGNTVEHSPTRIIICTGQVMKELVEKLFRQAGVRATTFEIRHSKGLLSNEFLCYSSFESKRIKWEQ